MLRTMDTLSPLSLKSRREALGLNRAQLAVEAGIAEPTLWRIETGRMGGQMETWRDLLGALDRIEKERMS